jgi:hypothetical protein
VTDESERNAMEAERLLYQEPLLNKALEGIEQDAIDRIVDAGPGDDLTRKTEAIRLQIVRDFRDSLEAYIRIGKSEVAAQNRNAGFI